MNFRKVKLDQGKRFAENSKRTIIPGNQYEITTEATGIKGEPYSAYFGVVILDESGKEIPFELVEPFLPARRKSTRQGTEKEILVRDYSLDSLKTIAFNGETYLMNTAVAPVAVKLTHTLPAPVTK